MSEFSNFARMPERKLRQVNLDDIIQNQVNIQKIANKNIEFKIQINKRRIPLHVTLIKLIDCL